MPKGDQGDMQRAQEQTYERFRAHAGADKEFAKAQAQAARDRLERKHDEGKGVLNQKSKDSDR